jgi:type II secretory pathway pseudopilin PulG
MWIGRRSIPCNPAPPATHISGGEFYFEGNIKTMLRQSNRTENGFTLKELPAVLLMLAILATIQVSAFSGGKDQSRIAQCAGNLKQFALALQIYGGENNDKQPSNPGVGNWVWDVPWNAGTVITQWISYRQLYCPGTRVRFTDLDNLQLWRSFQLAGYHIIGYAATFPGAPSMITTNQNPNLTPQRVSNIIPAPKAAARVLAADATISLSGQYNPASRYTYEWTTIQGGFGKPHITPHLHGKFPAGGNSAMLDGHIEWRRFDEMQCRTEPASGTPGFWW